MLCWLSLSCDVQPAGRFRRRQHTRIFCQATAFTRAFLRSLSSFFFNSSSRTVQEVTEFVFNFIFVALPRRRNNNQCECVCVCVPAVADYVHLSVVRATPLCVLICFARLFVRLFPLLLCVIFAATLVLRFILCRFSNKMHNLYALVRFGGHCQFHGPFHGHCPTLTIPTHVCMCAKEKECEKHIVNIV